MTSIGWARISAAFVGFCVFALIVQACGGGGGGGGGSNGGPTPTPSGPTATPPPNATPVPTAEGFLVVRAGDSLAAVARTAAAGQFVVVAPGTYTAAVFDDLADDVFLYGDETGELTDSAPAPVTIVARGDDLGAVQIYGQVGLSLEGFTIRGGSFAGILVTDSVGISISNCTVTRSQADAILFERSDSALLFNNLLAKNEGAGIALLGTPNTAIINNTIYNNSDTGIFLGTDDENQPSTDAYLRNNILNLNSPVGILVDTFEPSSLDGFDGDYNLNTDDYDGPDPGSHDIQRDPFFIFPNGLNFRLASPGSRAIDAGDDSIGADLVGALTNLTTQLDNSPDAPPVDLGYHYPLPIPTPTRAS